MKRNNTIDLLKFIFCIIILLFHTYQWRETSFYFLSGSICVEFFFITSGYLMAASASKQTDKIKKDNKSLGLDTLNFILKKFKYFFPYIVVVYITCIFFGISNNISIDTMVKSIFDLLLLNMFTYPSKSMIGFSWYISSMLFGMLILYPLIKKYKNTYYCVIAPIIFLILLSYMSHNFSSIKKPLEWTELFFYRGTLRAIMELSLGSMLYKIVMYLKKFNYKKWFRFFLTLIEFIGYLGFILVLTRVAKYDYVSLFIIAGLVGISFSEITYSNSILSCKFINYLARISLPIYLCQAVSINIMKIICNNFSSNVAIIVYITITILLGIFTDLLVTLIKKINFKKLLITD